MKSPAVMGHDACRSVHGPQVETVLLDLEAVSVKLAAGLQDLQVTVALDVQVLQDEEHHLGTSESSSISLFCVFYLLLVNFVINRSLYPLFKMAVKPDKRVNFMKFQFSFLLCVILPNLP